MGGTVVVFSCMQPDPKTQVQPLCSPLCLEAFPTPPPAGLQSVCPSDPPLNPDYYGFVFFQPVICKDGGLLKVTRRGCRSDNGAVC